MTPITRDDVLAHAPELALTDTAWTDVLAYVNQWKLTHCDSDADRRLARIYLAAHIGVMSKRGASAGPLTSESAGDVKRSYAVLTSSDSLESSRYGQLFSEVLSASLGHGPFVI